MKINIYIILFGVFACLITASCSNNAIENTKDSKYILISEQGGLGDTKEEIEQCEDQTGMSMAQNWG